MAVHASAAGGEIVDKKLGAANVSTVKVTAAYKRVGDVWAAWLEEIPGVHTQGETQEEARENLKDALAMVLEANRELAEREQPSAQREVMVLA